MPCFFLSSDVRKPCQGMDYPGWRFQPNLEGVWLHGRGWPDFPERPCSREGKADNIFVLIISISRWNQIHIGSTPSNNEPITIHWEDKSRKIETLDIDADFSLQWILYFLGRRWIPVLLWGWKCEPLDSLVVDARIVSFYLLVEKMCICVYVYIIVNIVSRWFIKLHRQYGCLLVEANVYVCICGYYCKYHNELHYKSPVNSMIVMFQQWSL